MKKLITIFGPGQCIAGDPVYDRAYRLGCLLADAGFAIVTGGYDGVMEAASKGAHEHHGWTIGVTANVYFNRDRMMNPYVKKEVRVSSAVDRLMELISLADAYVACGISPGTIAEVSMVWEYFSKKFIEVKPLILLGAEWRAYCDALFSQDGYRDKEHYVTIVSTPEEAMEILITKFGRQENLPELSILG
ncbi:MAG TPA: LOG family protein [Candidatus Kapabacteria bacterium]|nr:LOG family protein [Candidatus Kapabacteria bacterium]